MFKVHHFCRSNVFATGFCSGMCFCFFPFQAALEKSKQLHLQVQTATYQKMISDLESDMEILKSWTETESKRKASWQGMVLTHVRRRYVRGLERVREFCEESIRVRHGALNTAEMELAAFRSNLEAASTLKCQADSRWGFKSTTLVFIYNMKVQSCFLYSTLFSFILL